MGRTIRRKKTQFRPVEFCVLHDRKIGKRWGKTIRKRWGKTIPFHVQYAIICKDKKEGEKLLKVLGWKLVRFAKKIHQSDNPFTIPSWFKRDESKIYKQKCRHQMQRLRAGSIDGDKIIFPVNHKTVHYKYS